MTTLIQLERRDHVALLTFNDPEKLNAMTEPMGMAFTEQIRALVEDEGLRALVLTGAGRAFSAGGDLDWIEARADTASAAPGKAREEVRDTMRRFYGLFLAVRDLPCPSIAAINGPAIGAGLCVALACDIRIASEKAKLGLNFARLGLHPGMGATWTLPRLVGPAHAAELLYTARIFGAREAERIGLVNRAVAPDAVVSDALAVADEIATASPLANRGIKQALARSPEATLDDQLLFEASEQAVDFESRDVREGLAAVRERRSPKFSGR